MKGDFSRDTFNATKHFSRLMMQQGRVQLDADWNEQASIAAHYLRSLAADLIGPHGGPGDGFKISRIPAAAEQPLEDLSIAAGRYYVSGLLCEHVAEAGEPGAAATYWTQRDLRVCGDVVGNSEYRRRIPKQGKYQGFMSEIGLEQCWVSWGVLGFAVPRATLI